MGLALGFLVSDNEIVSMDDAEFALIYENGVKVKEVLLEHSDEHPGIHNLVQIIPVGVNGIVTVHCDPPGFRLAQSKNVNLYNAVGKIEEVVKGIESGMGLPTKEAQQGHHHHHS